MPNANLFMIARIHGDQQDRDTTITSTDGGTPTDPPNHVLFPIFNNAKSFAALLHQKLQTPLPATLIVASMSEADCYTAGNSFVQGKFAGFELDPTDVLAGGTSYWDGTRWHVPQQGQTVHAFRVRRQGTTTVVKEALVVDPPADTLVLDFLLVLQTP